MSDPLLAISNLSIERGERLLFRDYALWVAAGEIVQVAGANGAGKTSLMRAISGLLDPSSGRYSWRGKAVNSANLFSDEVLYLGHKPAVRYQLTALENLRWYAQLHRQQIKSVDEADLIEALAALGLAGYEHELCSSLSAGQKRRVGLARLAISNAPLWILDEPFTAVDVDGVKTLCSWIENYVDEGGAVLYSTHQQVEFSTHVPRVIDLATEMLINNASSEQQGRY